jgi:hypothetical protein
MRLHAHRHSLQEVTPNVYIARPQAVQLSAQDRGAMSPSRHDAQMLAPHSAPVDPYAAFLQQREAEREREQPREVRWVYRQLGTLSAAPRVSADGPRDPHERRPAPRFTTA